MIPTQQPHLIVAALSHPGESGKNNEDRARVASFRLSKDRTPVLLAIVADGIGGHQAGEVAAELAIDTFTNMVGASVDAEPLPLLRQGIVEASRAIQRASRQAVELEGMGSTIAIAYVVGDRFYSATVGDSRIYYLSWGVLRQVSTDHTWIQEAIEHHIITPQEAKDHPHAHVLHRHLGGLQDPQPDLRLRLSPEEDEARSLANQGLKLNPGDQILLCSDGLTDLVRDDEIHGILHGNPSDEAARRLVDLARSRGGHDNITVVILVAPKGVRRKPHRRTRMALAGLLGAAALIALVTLGAAVAWWFGFWPWPSVRDSAPTVLPAQATSSPFPMGVVPSVTPVPSPAISPSPTPVPSPTSTAITLPIAEPSQTPGDS